MVKVHRDTPSFFLLTKFLVTFLKWGVSSRWSSQYCLMRNSTKWPSERHSDLTPICDILGLSWSVKNFCWNVLKGKKMLSEFFKKNLTERAYWPRCMQSSAIFPLNLRSDVSTYKQVTLGLTLIWAVVQVKFLNPLTLSVCLSLLDGTFQGKWLDDRDVYHNWKVY